MRLLRKAWTKEEIDTLSRMYPDHYAKEIAVILGRSAPSIWQKALKLGLVSSPEKIRGTRYTKGHVPDNKGKKMTPDVYAKVSRTMFKKGQPPVNHREVGSERVNVDGYIEVKVAEPNRWRLKHRVIWEQAYGQIPRGHNVQFKNHNPQDCRIENLYLISKADQMAKENSSHVKYPKELQEIIHLKGVVNRAIHKAQRNGK